MFHARCPSCGYHHERWGHEGAAWPSEIKCHCDARFSIAYLTREALHETVWSEAVSRLAARYAISGVGLKRLCRRAGVPVPPVGYWQLNAVLVGVTLIADAKRTERLAVERRQREWQEAERRRAEAEARRREEAERFARLEAEASAWSKSQRLRAYADAVEREAIHRGIPVEPGTEVHRWLEWARAHADRLDPIKAERT
jgi:hypothetical protein